MANNNSNKKSTKKSLKKSSNFPKSAKIDQKFSKSSTNFGYVLVILCVVVAILACVVYMSSERMTPKKNKVPDQRKGSEAKSSRQGEKTTKGNDNMPNVPPEVRNFKPSFQKKLKMNSNVRGRTLNIRELQPTHENNSSVRAYVIENFLNDYECDGLMQVHNKHLEIFNQNDPFICFDSVSTLIKNLKELKLKYKVSSKDFFEGTTCLNESFSSALKSHFKWSYSTAFYPGENKFSLVYEQHIKQATGLNPENGGKFQITSYPIGVGYKSHTDCVLYEKGRGELRDRFATVLVYLQDVEKGGETDFPLLGMKVKPKKGLALVWNSMDEHGNCERLSLHDAKKVAKGHKYIIQRWYYYKSFPALGKRPPEPSLPKRKPDQPRVSCDEYEQGSCRWYDEWNYDHILEYNVNRKNLL